ncbi:MAG: zinc ribbon domain-containing protein [Lachnospiraceae bacterium]|nr:zinc ribbon domain-containing protein [Lachnospiraceae bacterium]
MKCPNCGVEADSKFCPECGNPMKVAEQKPEKKKCPNCGTESDSRYCPECGSPMNESESIPVAPIISQEDMYNTPQYAATQKKNNAIIIAVVGAAVIIIAVISVIIAMSLGNGEKRADIKHSETTEESLADAATDKQAKKDSTKKEKSTEETQSTVVQIDESESPSSESEDTGDGNEYYDVVSTEYYKTDYYTYRVDKVVGKQDVYIKNTAIVSKNNKVIGKISDDIILQKGKTNCFVYGFEGDMEGGDYKIQSTATPIGELYRDTGDMDAVEMVDYNLSDDNLYITFRQTKDKIASFAGYRLLFYDGDTLVNCEDGYFRVYCENLNGKDTTDVASIWAYNLKFDKIEYYYEAE